MENSKLYIEHVIELLHAIANEQDVYVQQASDLLVETIKQQHSIFIFGASHAGILAQEMFYRTGGLVVVNPILPREVMLDVRPIIQTSQMERLAGYGKILADNSKMKAHDVLIIHSVSGRNTIAIDMALEAKKKGIAVIAIINVTYSKQVKSRHACGKNLYQIADIVIDNCGDFEDSCMLMDGMKQKVAPTSTITGAAIINSLVIQVVEKLLKQQIEPPIFHSANVDGGDAFNKALIEKYKDQIFYM